MGKKAKAKKEKHEETKQKLGSTQMGQRVINAREISNFFTVLPEGRNIVPSTSEEKLTATCARVDDMNPEDITWAFELVKTNMREMYLRAKIGWYEKEKKKEMKTPKMHYVIVRDSNDKRVGFVSFLFDVEFKLDVAYLYEIHLDNAAQGKGLGSYLMELHAEIVKHTQISKSILTCFTENTKGQKFFREGHQYIEDAYSPDGADYNILSRIMTENEPEA